MSRRKRSLSRFREEIEITETRPRIGIRRDENGFLESNMRHQCQRNDKEGVVRCTKCKVKRYCYPCRLSWYPEMSAEAIAEACPVCRIKCNCKPCLRMEVSNHAREEIREKSMFMIGNEQKIQYSKYMIKSLLPFLEQINKEQVIERELEAKIQGVSVSDIQVDEVKVNFDESIYCDNFRASIANYHRSCPLCSYELCLGCCRELRDGHLQGGEKGPPFKYVDYGIDYLHGSIQKRKSKNIDDEILTIKKWKNNRCSPSHWKTKENGVISCPPKDKGGCGEAILILKCLFPYEFVSKLLVEAKNMFDAHKMDFVPECLEKSCFCYNVLDGEEVSSKKICIAASREDSSDNKLYRPSAVDIGHGDLQHFQSHWSKCEPVIISNVLETTVGLSWEPMVMYRAFRQPKSQGLDTLLNMTAINCLDWCEMDVNLHQFFKGYLDAYTDTQFDAEGWPKILKLEDWPPCPLFEKLLPRHGVEFISCLPFKEYTHPQDGYLNIATKLPPGSLIPDVGPKTSIAYGFCEELGRGDSVTKLRCNMADAVDVLTHLKEVSISPYNVKKIKKVKAKHAAQDQIEISGAAGDESKALKEPELANKNKAGLDVALGENGTKDDKEKILVTKALNAKKKGKGPCDVRQVHVYANDQIQLQGGIESVGPIMPSCSLYDAEGGALWDIFRQQDVPKLEEYIRRHFNEFRHIHGNLLPQVIHPIHDRTIYLTVEHKKRLKEEYGIEPWTFVQKLGDAVLIPAGCPHQVRNLKSCIKVALEFVSPESISSCLRLTEELRLLPLNHRAKEDKLEVKKMIIHAMRRAVDDLLGAISSQPCQPMKRFHSITRRKRRK